MDVLEHALDQLRQHDTRPAAVRLRAVERALDAARPAILAGRSVDPGDGPDRGRRAAARLAVEALAVLAACDGLAADVGAALAGALTPAGSRDESARPGSRNYPALVHDTADCRDPHLGPPRQARAGVGVYPPGPAGDRLAFLDLEHNDDD